jgi:toxin ParE1/3/4
MKVEWSARALADLDRFALFLQERHPHLADIVGAAILAKAEVLAVHPLLGRPIPGRKERTR